MKTDEILRIFDGGKLTAKIHLHLSPEQVKQLYEVMKIYAEQEREKAFEAAREPKREPKKEPYTRLYFDYWDYATKNPLK